MPLQMTAWDMNGLTAGASWQMTADFGDMVMVWEGRYQGAVGDDCLVSLSGKGSSFI